MIFAVKLLVYTGQIANLLTCKSRTLTGVTQVIAQKGNVLGGRTRSSVTRCIQEQKHLSKVDTRHFLLTLVKC